MFTELLNEDEKKDFLELVYKVANYDGEFAEEEQELVNNYKIELGLDEISDTKSIEQLIMQFSKKSIQLQKIVFFELYGMVMADGKIESKEEEILSLVEEQFKLEKNDYSKLVEAANSLQQAYDKVYSAIFD